MILGTHVFATPEEVAELRQKIAETEHMPLMMTGVGHKLSFGEIAMNEAQKLCQRMANDHGLSQEGVTYGMLLETGQFVYQWPPDE